MFIHTIFPSKLIISNLYDFTKEEHPLSSQHSLIVIIFVDLMEKNSKVTKSNALIAAIKFASQVLVLVAKQVNVQSSIFVHKNQVSCHQCLLVCHCVLWMKFEPGARVTLGVDSYIQTQKLSIALVWGIVK